MAHPAHDKYWDGFSLRSRLGDVTVPALHLGGWFDITIGQTTKTFAAARREAATREAREGQRLVIGPWDHLDASGVYPDRDFGPRASVSAFDLMGLYVRFFERWLRGNGNALDGVAPVRIFVMGIDQWRDEQDWPLPDTHYVNYFLTSGGHANTADGDGKLVAEPPSREAVDSYDYDPLDPVPTAGGACLPMDPGFGGPVDQRVVSSRPDVLCFATPPLRQAVEVTGFVTVTLFVTSSAPDTDFTAKLVDVDPDGRAINLCDGILRTRNRNGVSREELMDPGEVYEIEIDLTATANVFLPGHRIRLDVSSSNFPRYDRNTNTGDDDTAIGRELGELLGIITQPLEHACAIVGQGLDQKEWATHAGGLVLHTNLPLTPSYELACPSRRRSRCPDTNP